MLLQMTGDAARARRDAHAGTEPFSRRHPLMGKHSAARDFVSCRVRRAARGRGNRRARGAHA
ncbi:fumarate hydratase [Burkholderia pseudomallei]|nr:fumarate hydratase [Burkholderia pseudomallei]MPT64442.1 fumarate hydratase [Burkholderia pseudomallei]MPT70867.1 fumarate hydratase [Burkholderia pseudomallei]MPT78148.1 fumarate hydratase [Burkholderia pseudomallei]MPT85926.1 fumarate hydratase [Burkholderia pseudomallei]